MRHPDSNRSKRPMRGSSNSHISMSDAESTCSQVDSWHSPLQYDDPCYQPEIDHSCYRSSKSLVSVDKYYSPLPSPGESNFPASSTPAVARNWRNAYFQESPAVKSGRMEKSVSEDRDFSTKGTSPVVLGLNRIVKVEPLPPPRVSLLRKALLLLRVFEAIASLISFSVMAADETRGWTGDSYDRYKEYKYCVTVNVIGFVYSSFQAFVVAYHLGTGKHVISPSIQYHFDFSIDQILSYLILSASSSAATRSIDWMSNWGKDEFTSMANASTMMSFLGFIAFAFTSLLSGYNLYNHSSH